MLQREVSHPTMGAWIEIRVAFLTCLAFSESHPTMGAWIEIINVPSASIGKHVAPHDGCVD